jgi:ubiquinone/menaquinone biosynthesis C-methylase UbiE
VRRQPSPRPSHSTGSECSTSGGTGRITRFAATRAASVYAFDPNAESVAQAQTLLPNSLRERVTFAVHGVEELDRPRRRFDLALAAWSL